MNNGAHHPNGKASEYEQPSAPEAVERAVEAAHQLIVDRLELARLELQRLVGLLRTAVVAVILTVSIWATLVAATVVLLQEWLPLAGALAATAGLQAAIGLVALAATRPAGGAATGGTS